MLRLGIIPIFTVCHFSALAQEAQEPEVEKATVAADTEIAPPLLQAEVKGLLVMTLPDGSHAGAASQMNATAVKGTPSSFKLNFNQSVGPLMNGATDEVEKFIEIRHPNNLPMGYNIEFGFADKHSLKDGPSAAVACALMAESIITGSKLDANFAATGDMTATGEVRPIGGVDAKVRAAIRKKCTVFTVPKGNSKSIDDVYISEGLKGIAVIQIITVGTFEEAFSVAKVKKSEEVATALKDFEAVQKAVARNEGNAKHPMVQEKLKAVLKAIPGHHSARLIALHGQGRGPKKLSLAGSLTNIDLAAEKLSALISNGHYRDTSGLDDPLRNTVFELSRIRSSLDPRTTGLLDAYSKIAQFVKERRGRKYLSPNEIKVIDGLISKLEAERAKIQNNQEIQEELIGQ